MGYRVHVLVAAAAAVVVFVVVVFAIFPSILNGNLQTKAPLRSQKTKKSHNSSAKFKVCTANGILHIVFCVYWSEFCSSFSQDFGHRLIWAQAIYW